MPATPALRAGLHHDAAAACDTALSALRTAARTDRVSDHECAARLVRAAHDAVLVSTMQSTPWADEQDAMGEAAEAAEGLDADTHLDLRRALRRTALACEDAAALAHASRR